VDDDLIVRRWAAFCLAAQERVKDGAVSGGVFNTRTKPREGLDCAAFTSPLSRVENSTLYQQVCDMIFKAFLSSNLNSRA